MSTDPRSSRREHLTDRVAGLQDALVARGVLSAADVDDAIDLYQRQLGPRRGAAMVAKAWADSGYRQRLLSDATQVLADDGYDGAGATNSALPFLRLVVVENTSWVHNLIVCTLCSCYPLALLGPQPRWYKSAQYRARAIRRPREVLAEFGTKVGDEVTVRVWDSTADCRYMVLPQQPVGTESFGAAELAELVTVDALIGTQRELPYNCI
jgi:nitrile hydratase